MRGEGFVKAMWFIFLSVFCWPFIGAADQAITVIGIPSIFLYLFLGWAVLVAMLIVASRKLED